MNEAIENEIDLAVKEAKNEAEKLLNEEGNTEVASEEESSTEANADSKNDVSETEQKDDIPPLEENNDKIPEVDTKPVFEPVKIKDRGFEIVVDNFDDLVTLAHKGLNYENKKAELKEAKELKEFISNNKLSNEDLQILIDAKNGDKSAIVELAKRAKVDIYDINDKESYTPSKQTFGVRNEIQDAINEVSADGELYENVRTMFNVLPEDFKQTLLGDPTLFKYFAYGDVKNGVAQKALPDAMKNFAVNPHKYVNGFIDAYVEASVKIINSQKEEKKPVENTKVDELKRQKVIIDKANNGASESTFEEDERKAFEGNLSPQEIVEIAKRQAQRLKANIKG
jgi:hypothetical protein